jgi:hypothetical protein
VGFDLSGQGVSLPSAASSPVLEAMGSLGRSSGAPVASPAVFETPSIGFASVGFRFSSQLVSSS